MKEEMMNDAIDDAMGDEDDEEERCVVMYYLYVEVLCAGENLPMVNVCPFRPLAWGRIKNWANCPPPFAKAGDNKTNSSVCMSVTKTLTWFKSSEILMTEHWYLACMILVTSPYNLHHAVTLTLVYFKVKVVARRGTTILQICLLNYLYRIMEQIWREFKFKTGQISFRPP